MPDIQNIPTTQYIGPRIIPHLWDPIAWDESTQYDALAVVQYNGVPYIARYVPPQGTLPTDAEYWVRWADFNAQMAQLQQTVESFDNRITANATDIGTLEAIVPLGAFSSTNTVQKAINDEATARQQAIEAANAAIADTEALARSTGYVIPSAQDLASVQIEGDASIFVAGYYEAGDGGAGVWVSVDENPNGIDVLATANGAAKYAPGEFVNAGAMGVIGTQSDIDARIERAFAVAVEAGLDIIFPCAFYYERTIEVTTQATFCKRIQYNGTGYGMSYNAGSMKSLTFNILACPNGGGLIMEQSGNDTITNVNVTFNRIYAGSGIGMYLHSITHGIMECRFTGDLVQSDNHALQIKCEDGYDAQNLPFFGQNIFDVVRFCSINNYAVDMQVGETFSTITGVLFEPTSFEGSANGVRFYTGSGNGAQLKGVHFAEIRTFEQLTNYMLNMAGGRIFSNSLNFSTPVQIDKIHVNAAQLIDDSYIPTSITGGVFSPTWYMFANALDIINAGIMAYKTDRYFTLRPTANWTFGEDTAHYRILSEVYNDQGQMFDVHAGFLNGYGIRRIIVNQNPANNSTVRLYDADDDLIFDGTDTTDTQRTAYLIELATGLVNDPGKKIVSITKLGHQSHTAF